MPGLQPTVTTESDTRYSNGVQREPLDAPSLSVIVPVTARTSSLGVVVKEYLETLVGLTDTFELVCVVDGAFAHLTRELVPLKADFPQLGIVTMPRSFGDATAISVAFEASRGERVLLLPPYRHVLPQDLEHLLDSAEEADVVVGCREPRLDGRFNKLQTRIFSLLASRISGLKLKDAGCAVCLVDRAVLEEVQLYGDFHRFLPLLADRQGFTVRECPLRQAPEDQRTRVHSPGVYVRRLLDLLSVYFILRFTKKPFRFFGLIGSGLIALGGIVSAWVVVERLAFGVALADRPALLLGSLLMVFGLQILSVGLIGEIIIFSHAREMKEFNVRRVIE